MILTVGVGGKNAHPNTLVMAWAPDDQRTVAATSPLTALDPSVSQSPWRTMAIGVEPT